MFTVPVTVNGKPLRMQVDTGADYGGLYGQVEDWPDAGFVERDDVPAYATSVAMDVGGVTLNTETVLHYESNSISEIAGTIGYDNLRDRIWMIDPRADRFCHIKPGHPALGSLRFVDTPVRFNKQYLPLKFEGEAVDGLFFDTGSVFSLLVPELWERTTDPDGEDMSVEVPSWGEMVRLEGRTAKGGWTLGGELLAIRALIREDDPASLQDARLDQPMQGLLGMSAFDGRTVVLDLREGQERFGWE